MSFTESKTSQAVQSAPIQTVFSSIQGEGVWVGKRQVFVRFAHCHLKCAYCDTPMTSASGQCHIENIQTGISKPVPAETLLANPVAVETLLQVIDTMQQQARHHSISFTGGEPLLYHRFLADCLPRLKATEPELKIYLETSGTQPEFLEPLLPLLDMATDMIAMDIKLPSATGEPPQFEAHQAFYQKALKAAVKNPQRGGLFVKLVFNPKITTQELEAVRQIVSHRQTPIILQPETSLADQQVHMAPSEIFRVEQALARYFDDVRVIPQTHKMLRVS